MSSGIEKQVKYYQEKYYNGKAEITDEAYDALVSLANIVDAIGPTGDTPHVFPMWSLQKVYPLRGDKTPSACEGHKLIESPKYDGIAIELVYFNGILVRATTRGDGEAGLDITDKVKLLDLPSQFFGQSGIFQVTGEVVATKTAANARNIVSGKLVSEKDLKAAKDTFEEYGVVFIAYGCMPALTNSYEEDMKLLDAQGFDVAVMRPYEDLAPQDGTVFRVDDNSVYKELGFTSKHPRAAYAVKHDAPPVSTTLNNVEWQVGASGKVTPVAILEPVDINGTTISRATLNNISYIEALGLEIGCKVFVIRAGDIIPKIVGRCYD